MLTNITPVLAVEDIQKSTATPKQYKSMVKKNKKVSDDYTCAVGMRNVFHHEKSIFDKEVRAWQKSITQSCQERRQRKRLATQRIS